MHKIYKLRENRRNLIETSFWFLFLIGASGAGKTTTVKVLEKEGLPNFVICYFDSIGVPPEKEMIEQYGSREEWQRVKTVEWVKRIKAELLPKTNVILDAQTRPAFIEEACRENSISDSKTILIDCTDEMRRERLEKRKQAELANDRMMNWAKFLRNECEAQGCTILDTSRLTPDETLSALKEDLAPLEHNREMKSEIKKH
jgi:dephospho-CoA kinase